MNHESEHSKPELHRQVPCMAMLRINYDGIDHVLTC